MKYLWADLRLIERKVTQSEKILLLLDYDGTLTPIADRPEDALLPSRTKDDLALLLQIPRYLVGIVTGRAVDDVAALVGIEDVIYAGNHGLEILYPGGCWVHPEAARLRPKLAEIRERLNEELGHIPGLLLEDKGVTVSIHYRLVAGDPREEVQRGAQKVLEPFAVNFQLTEGEKVLEVRPAVFFHKGTVIHTITQMVNVKESDLVIYIGDDETDEDAFAALKPKDIGIRVGESASSRAAYFALDTEEVCVLLEALGQWGGFDPTNINLDYLSPFA